MVVGRAIDPTANTLFRRKRAILPKTGACAEWILLWHVQQTHSGFHRHYTQTSPKFLILLKRAQVLWMCFIILNDLYTVHHNLLGICQLKVRHLYGTFNFSTQCICMGIGNLFVYGFRRFRGKVRPLRRKTVFAVASIDEIGIFHVFCTQTHEKCWFEASFGPTCDYKCHITSHSIVWFSRTWSQKMCKTLKKKSRKGALRYAVVGRQQKFCIGGGLKPMDSFGMWWKIEWNYFSSLNHNFIVMCKLLMPCQLFAQKCSNCQEITKISKCSGSPRTLCHDNIHRDIL